MGSEFEFEEPDVDGLIEAAAKKKGSAVPAKSKRKRAAAEKSGRKAAKAKAASDDGWTTRPAAKQRRKAADESPGVITRGVGAAFHGAGAAAALGLWTWVASVALLAVVTLSLAGWMRAPDGHALDGIHFARVEVPTLLQEQWLRSFHQFNHLRRSPDRAVLDAFSQHLVQQPSVASVERVELVWVERGPQLPPSRQVEVTLSLRQPVVPVQLAGGRRAWVDQEGVVLSPLLPGPKGEPLVRGYEEGGIEAMHEFLAVWPQLRQALPAGLVTGVDLDHLLGSTGQRGIVFHTGPGAVLIWGRPGEDRFGLTRQRKIRNLVHTISCQGDLSKVKEINVRFPGPWAKDPRLGS